jgi:hypothetical protein
MWQSLIIVIVSTTVNLCVIFQIQSESPDNWNLGDTDYLRYQEFILARLAVQRLLPQSTTVLLTVSPKTGIDRPKLPLVSD